MHRTGKDDRMGNFVRYVIEGRGFYTIESVHIAAKLLGSDILPETLRRRMKRGASTWDELLKPMNDNRRKGQVTRQSNIKDSRAECAAIMAEMDRRKSAMGVKRG